jgi:small subunit ribosomal protein S17
MSETNARTVSGQVVSAARDKTITVMIERRVAHALYGKIVKRSTKLHAHDEQNEAQVGDKVTIIESRPFSKQKTWKLVSIDERAASL